MRVELQPVYVLHSRAYRETSLLADLLTVDFGLVAAVVKGARRKSRSRVPVQLFCPYTVSWAGKGDLKSLLHLELAGRVTVLPGLYSYAAMYVNEVLTRLLQPADPHSDIYYLYQNTLARLSVTGAVESALRDFEFALLSALGYGVDWQHDCCTGEPVRADSEYWFDPAEGFTLRQAPQSRVFSGSDILAIAAGDYARDSVRQAAKHLARLALAPHLGDKPLKSRELFRSYTS